jgi:hypothetical protein
MSFPDFNDEPDSAASSTAELCDALALYGRPAPDDGDRLPPPEPAAIDGALADIFDALVSLAADTLLERELGDLLWAQVNLFQRQLDRIERRLDANEVAQKQSQTWQDGSEVRSVQLEQLLAQGQAELQRRDLLENARDRAAELHLVHAGQVWNPRSGSKVNRAALTAAIIDSRDFMAARRRADALTLAPAGPRIAFTGGIDFNDHRRIWAALDRIAAKHSGMVLLHGASPRGAERIAACWAENRKVPQVAFRPDWAHHGKAAPFKRNDAILEALPLGVLAFPGSGISDNLADKARSRGIPVWRFRPG